MFWIIARYSLTLILGVLIGLEWHAFCVSYYLDHTEESECSG